eukprot:TRINITY_DN15055_c0_g1_i1.p1 TRINITY_DN15055_c0_g1~~TRINITY_DN15055_c0_g1_i1.p1  ORF type:complete len:117 (-),score=6.30 TRINITY_DN15055_c0_g1_i1:99-416(-)
MCFFFFFFFQAEDGIRDVERSRGLGDVYKRQDYTKYESIISTCFLYSFAVSTLTKFIPSLSLLCSKFFSRDPLVDSSNTICSMGLEMISSIICFGTTASDPEAST